MSGTQKSLPHSRCPEKSIRPTAISACVASTLGISSILRSRMATLCMYSRVSGKVKRLLLDIGADGIAFGDGRRLDHAVDQRDADRGA